MSKKCYCQPCRLCLATGAVVAFQGTISDISQVNTPPADPTPPCACTTYNVTLPFTPFSYDQTLPAFITDALSGGKNCRYITANSECGAAFLNGVRAEMIKYQNDSGGVSCYGLIEISESSIAMLSGNVGTFEGTAVIDAASDVIDCSIIDVTVPVTKTGDFGTFGGTVWCGGTTLNLRVESI